MNFKAAKIQFILNDNDFLFYEYKCNKKELAKLE